jgi:ribosomal protein S18 acetylase RimI-like enzyme
MHIRTAATADIPELVDLVNKAYRGDGGWTNESHLIGGPRTTSEDVEGLLRQTKSVILLGLDQEGIAGCVYLEKENQKLYLGMLSVAPERQGAGIGKRMMESALEYAREQQCTAIRITVISVREELIAWYERQGFRRTGELEPFHAGDRFGTQKRPLELAILEKEVR